MHYNEKHLVGAFCILIRFQRWWDWRCIKVCDSLILFVSIHRSWWTVLSILWCHSLHISFLKSNGKFGKRVTSALLE